MMNTDQDLRPKPQTNMIHPLRQTGGVCTKSRPIGSIFGGLRLKGENCSLIIDRVTIALLMLLQNITFYYPDSVIFQSFQFVPPHKKTRCGSSFFVLSCVQINKCAVVGERGRQCALLLACLLAQSSGVFFLDATAIVRFPTACALASAAPGAP